MDLHRAFEDYKEFQSPEWQNHLRFCACVKPDHANFEELLRLCRIWCCLSDFLHCKRPEKLRSPLRFTIGEHETDSYWFHLVYCSRLLGKEMIDRIAARLGLRDKVTGAAVSNAAFADALLCDLLHDAASVLGVLYYCSTVAFRCSLWVERTMPDACDSLLDNLHLLRIAVCWMSSRLTGGKASETAAWVRTTEQLIDEDKRWEQYQMIAALKRDCAVQLWLLRAQYFIATDADAVSAASCYEEAQRLGWQLNEDARDVVDERESMQRAARPADELVEKCSFFKALNDPPLRGINPLNFAPVRTETSFPIDPNQPQRS